MGLRRDSVSGSVIQVYPVINYKTYRDSKYRHGVKQKHRIYACKKHNCCYITKSHNRAYMQLYQIVTKIVFLILNFVFRRGLFTPGIILTMIMMQMIRRSSSKRVSRVWWRAAVGVVESDLRGLRSLRLLRILRRLRPRRWPRGKHFVLKSH